MQSKLFFSFLNPFKIGAVNFLFQPSESCYRHVLPHGLFAPPSSLKLFEMRRRKPDAEMHPVNFAERANPSIFSGTRPFFLSLHFPVHKSAAE